MTAGVRGHSDYVKKLRDKFLNEAFKTCPVSKLLGILREIVSNQEPPYDERHILQCERAVKKEGDKLEISVYLLLELKS